MIGFNEYRQFEDLVYRIFDVYGMSGQRELSIGKNLRVDFMIESRSDRAPVEVKLYGRPIIAASHLRNAVASVLLAKVELQTKTAVIVLSGQLAQRDKTLAQYAACNIQVLDLEEILYWAAINIDLYGDLETFFYALSTGDEAYQIEVRRAFEQAQNRQREDEPSKDRFADFLFTARLPETDALVPDVASEQSKEGELLCARLRKLPPGRPDANRFEALVTEIVKYLFADNFSKWETQNTLDTGLRMDLCGKLLPIDHFWKDVVRDFNCRYVTFEFKNYSKPITQEQVYSTEKYLLRDALRTIAIVISTQGADAGAHEASRGALREAGKVIVHLDVNDLCQMLSERDRGNPPERLLEDRLDTMLMSLAR